MQLYLVTWSAKGEEAMSRHHYHGSKKAAQAHAEGLRNDGRTLATQDYPLPTTAHGMADLLNNITNSFQGPIYG